MLGCARSSIYPGGFALLFDESSSLSAPIAFGTYRVLHQTGSGALGPVFRAFDPRQDRLVAVKAFKLDLLPEQVARLADALRRLVELSACHPALVAALDAGIEGTTPFVITPCQSGETLDVVMRRLPPLSLAEALAYLTPVAGAIDAAAAAGIDHGALHPRDIFIDGPRSADPGSIHVTGFGIARALESVNVFAETVRRPYTAPERSGVAWDARADVYSLGVIAHELLTRCRPACVGEQDGVFSTSVPSTQRVRLRRVLAGALSESVHQRYDTAGAFIEAMRAVGVREAPIAVPRSVQTPSAGEVPQQVPLHFSSDDSSGARTPVATGVAQVASSQVPPWAVPPIEALSAAATVLAESLPLPAAAHVARSADVPPVEAVRESEAVDFVASVPLQRLPATPIGTLGPRPRPLRLGRRRPAPPRLLVAAFALVAIAVGGCAAYFAGTFYRPAARSSVATGSVTPREENTDAAVGAAAPSADPTTGGGEPSASVDTDVPVKSAPQEPDRDVRRVSAPAGRLVIRSEPSGALVTVDGRNWGATPTTVRDLPLGTHAVRVARPGHVPRLERVTLRSAAPTQTLTFALEPGLAASTSGLGAIDIDSRPRAARVIVDGRFVGQAPLRIPQLRPGTYVVTLELDGYTSWTSRVTVEAGKSAALRPALRSTN